MFRTLFFAIFALASFAPQVANAGAPRFFAMDTAIRSLENASLAAELGYDGIGWRPDSPEKIARLLETLRSKKLDLFALYGSANLNGETLVWPEVIEQLFPVLKGSHTVIWLNVSAKEFAPSDPKADLLVVRGLRQLAERAASHGIRIALYPHKGAWLERVQDATRIARKVDHPALGVTFNLCHCLMVGDEARIAELLHEAGRYLFLVTINGADTNAPNSSWRRLIRPLDEGDFPLGTFLKILSATGYSGPIGLQGFGIPLPPEENLRRSIDAWRALHVKTP